MNTRLSVEVGFAYVRPYMVFLTCVEMHVHGRLALHLYRKCTATVIEPAHLWPAARHRNHRTNAVAAYWMRFFPVFFVCVSLRHFGRGQYKRHRQKENTERKMKMWFATLPLGETRMRHRRAKKKCRFFPLKQTHMSLKELVGRVGLRSSCAVFVWSKTYVFTRKGDNL